MKNILVLYPEIVQSQDISILRAIEIIDKTNSLVLVVNEKRQLLGTVIDSDIRKALLSGMGLDVKLGFVMNKKPSYIREGFILEEMLTIMKRKKHVWIPVVDKKKRVAALYFAKDFLGYEKKQPSSVVIMAGGQGSRLNPLTLDKPKPMIPIGGKPVIEIIINKLAESGFRKIFISVHHLSHIIKDYFGNGKKFNVEIEYLEEKFPLGTAGPLAQLKSCANEPVLVTNGDLLTQLKFELLLKFHFSESDMATICVREHRIEIPYGTIKVKGIKFDSIEEKPEEKWLINAGIYVFDPKTLELLEPGKYCDIPEFLEKINSKSPSSISCFPITEFWLDIGQPKDYELAISKYG